MTPSEITARLPARPEGRPLSVTPEVLLKLETAFTMGCTDSEASLYADISPSTLYKYCQEHPEFSERKEALKDKPVLLARATVFEALNEADHAKWYLERKRKSEFSSRAELSGPDGKDLLPKPIADVSKDNSVHADKEHVEENTSSPGGVISL